MRALISLPDRITDILHVSDSILQISFLAAQNDSVEVGVDDLRSQPFKFTDEL